MPELPEVETSRRGIEPYLEQQTITKIVIRQPQLRWPIPNTIQQLIGHKINHVSRRGKYLLLSADNGTVLLHLGMSGYLRILPMNTPAQKHDHVDIELSNHKTLRFTDPRRFGCLLWTDEDPLQHKLLKSLGPEPLTKDFTADYLFKRSRKRKSSIKQFIMDSKIVVGVGNIYANEALFSSGIRPTRQVGKITFVQYKLLVTNIKKVLRAAIKKGGTTLKDYQAIDGKPGYFSLSLKVYRRAGEACKQCDTVLKEIRLGQRSTVYCPCCQK